MKLLIVEDNEGLREQMKWALCDAYSIVEADTTQSSLDLFRQNGCEVVCLDMGLDNIPDRGLYVIDELIKIDRTVKIVVITAHTSETLGKEAIAHGAFDYLRKPVDIDELKVILARAVRLSALEEPLQNVTTDPAKFQNDFNMIGECAAMRKIFDAIQRLAQTDVNVLITGESGTGKEVCARAVHYQSQRRDAPFVPINCGAIPETLLESELFGYAKGAFTGATTNKKGLIESADNGTLFLDEIGDMPKHLQAKLLRFLEDQKYQRLGEVTICQANVRVIAATNRAVAAGDNSQYIRSDLYYRLSEFEIHLPPLRDRELDVVLLAQSIIQKNRERFSMPRLRLSKRTEQVLLQYTWPGNVRELENKLSRAAITCANQTIEPEDLQLPADSFKKFSLKEAKDLFEKNFIVNALRHAQYNIAATAENIGVSRPTLYDMIKKHGISINSDAPKEDKNSR